MSPSRHALRALALAITAPVLLFSVPASADPGSPPYAEQDLAVGGQGGFPNYRIPAVAVSPGGHILVSYDGRPQSNDAPGPNSILQRRSQDGGLTFGPQQTVHGGKNSPREGYSDPSFVVDQQTKSVFNFHVLSYDQGFAGSRPGTDPHDRQVLHAEVSRSDDDGQTWTHQTITAQITPDPTWRSRFATSGNGIQLRYGAHAGRLVQQFTIIDGGKNQRAVSVYSDDHGATWTAGAAVGTGMDENKVVELSDGRLMMNSRDSARSGYRKIAYSQDGGATWGEVSIDKNLIDPANNASLIRAYPDAPQGSAQAKVLLFSHAASSTSRTNGTIRMSCDDGKTWPVSKVFQPGQTAYTSLAVLPDGTIGLAYEPGHNGIRFARFDLSWLGQTCQS
ncbi:Sialidase [Austwickia sp. TVS 96-490-7B]|uniref:sialidase family protein n=1 Tax=Austwickia sp. TVS 96-490-7B TaxID=2830843 RepID=UPI001C567E98|nr:sialidase family protein [Austwickia sp. TVS 96-490-7B]MBW3086880.1 Sialidase [Austwickia sp. TVS 96-490-7B]